MSVVLSAATLFLSAAIVIITWLQWRVADNKLRFDLFDRRYKVYEATQKFLRMGVEEDALIDKHLVDFNRETAAAEFLFDGDVVNYLQRIRGRVQAEGRGAAVWLSDPKRIPEMTKAFAPYLGFPSVRFDATASHSMKRTLLAVGVAVLVSMMLTPRGPYRRIEMWVPFFWDTDYWRILWTPFILQTVFAAVVAAVIVNLFPRRPRK
jgi:hypothetical protein